MAIIDDPREAGLITIAGGPAGILEAGIGILDDHVSFVDVTFIARNTNQTSFCERYQSSWEKDAGGTPQEVGMAKATIWRGPGSGDWAALVEEDGTGYLRFRAVGSIEAFDTRWNGFGRISPLSAAGVTP